MIHSAIGKVTTNTIEDYKKRVMGCWLGKAIGGTLGMPFEGVDGPLDLTFYTPVPTEMLPNDDLDLQVVWACVLDNLTDIRVDRRVLAKAWLDHVEFPWDEYGVALRNLRNGVPPPLSGSFDNWFAGGMGAPIRSEIWACLAPGDPKIAAAYAFEDACVDHAGEGIWGEVFLAALESAAFIESNPYLLIDLALEQLPSTSLIYNAVADTATWWRTVGDWRVIRELILSQYGHENFTDATMNIAFTVLGWLAGKGDFSEAICIAVNCGKDTDCTGATVGALMGILNPDSVPDRWLEPIGRSLVISPGIVGLKAPTSLDAFTDLVVDLRERLAGKTVQIPDVFDSTAKLAIRVAIDFVSAMPDIASVPVLKSGRTLALAGTVGVLERSAYDDAVLLVRYLLDVPVAGEVRVMFNAREESRVWVDGSYAFGRAGGAMAPSLHRAPEGQSTVLHLTEGRHELVAALLQPAPGHDSEWVVGIGDSASSQWFPKAFFPNIIA